MKQLLQKLIALNLVPILLFCMLTMPVHAETSAAIAAGYCGGEGDGTNLTWTLTEDGTLTISGEGKMADYSSSDSLPWNNYRSDTKSVVINNGVTSIGDMAFNWCTALTRVVIANSVTSIGNRAFFWCPSLAEINIPASVTSIGSRAFSGYRSLAAIRVNENNPNYSSDSFGVLFNKDKTTLIQAPGTLQTYIIPDSVTSIGNNAFSHCKSLIEITIPHSVTSIGDYAFSDCYSLTEMTIPNSVTSIGDGAFSYCDSLTAVTIPNSVTSIGNQAFCGCYALIEVTIPDSVTSIGDWAFCGCYALIEVTIPDSVTSIGDGAFCGCYALIEVAIPDSVTSIGADAFSHCSALTEVTISNSVTSIGNWAFLGCDALTAIHVDENNSNYSNDNFGVLFNKDKTILIQAPGAIQTYIIPNSVAAIGDYAFSFCRALTEVTIPGSVTAIGNQAFSYCRALTELTIPDSVTSIGDKAFFWCDSLIEITIPHSVTSIGNEAFFWYNSLTAIHVEKNNPNYSSDSCGVLFNKDKTILIQAPSAIQTYTIPDSVTSVGNEAFSHCNSLIEITIPNSVTSIGSHAFSYCRALTEVTIPDSVTSISDGAFSHCYSLTEVTIPNSVAYIGNWAFSSCTTIHVVENNPNYSSDSFGVLFNKDKTSLIQAPDAIAGAYAIPGSVTSIGNGAFSGCSSLAVISIPDSVTSIGDRSFSNRSLTEVTIPDSVTSIGVWAFAASHSNLEVIRFTGDAPTGNRIFASVTATAYYPGWNETWTPEVMQNYVADTSPFGGKITWVPFDTAAILCETCTETETAVTILYDPDAAETVTGYIALYDKEGGFLRLETVTEQSNADGTIDLSISYTEEEYAGIGRIAAFVVNGDTMQPLCEEWDKLIT